MVQELWGIGKETWAIFLITLITFVVGFIVGLYQYREGQKWTRTEFVVNLISNFDSQDNVKIAEKMLDWNNRQLELPKSKNKIQFTNETLIKALRIDKTFELNEEEIREDFEQHISRHI